MRSIHSAVVAVIGSGLGGLAAACTLAARGYRVILFERSRHVGGKAAQLRAEGFRFDMGPTILTLPSLLRRIFQEAGRRMDDYLTLVRLDPQWRSFFDDGSALDLHADRDLMAETVAAFAPGTRSADGYRRFMDWSERLHLISERYFFDKSIGTLGDMFDFEKLFDARVARDVWSMRMGRTVAGEVRRHMPDPRVAQMMDHFTQYVGSSPYGSPAILCGIAHMQTSGGVWYPQGGIRSVPDALERLAGELGVEVRRQTAVAQILTDKERVSGVRTEDGEVIHCGAVVSNCDSVLTHRNLVDPIARQGFERRRSYEPACSGVVLYLGLDRRYEQLAHHNFAFSRDPRQEFDWIYHRGEPAPDPTCYIAATAATDPSTAPPGGEALYVLAHTPYLRPDHDWKRMLPEYRKVIIDKLRRTAGLHDLEDHIVFEDVLTPACIQEKYQVPSGAIYGLASHGRFMGAFKPANRSPDLRGLYLAGGSAHPGPGMPMVLMSGWIAADALDQDRVVERAGASSGWTGASEPAAWVGAQ
jgi:diapolycopene oxygenase